MAPRRFRTVRSHVSLVAASVIAILVCSCKPFDANAGALGSDAGAPTGIGDASPNTDAMPATLDGGNDGGAIPDCDAFNHGVVESSMWADAQGSPQPIIASEQLLLSVQSSAQTGCTLTSNVRNRFEMAEIRAKVNVTDGDFSGGGFTGRIDVLLVDGSTADASEHAVVSIDEKGWLVRYREFPSAQTVAVRGPALTLKTPVDLIFTVRFHPTEGFVRLKINGVDAIAQDKIGTQGIERKTWAATIGLAPVGATPLANATMDDVCLSPP